MSTTINIGSSVNFTVSNGKTGNWYALLDNSGVSYATSNYRTADNSFVLASNVFSNAGTFNLKLSADALSGCPASFAAATVTVLDPALPVQFIDVTVKRSVNSTQLSWRVDNEINVDHYEVERSGDGSQFDVVGSQQYKYTTTSNLYNFIDYSELDPGVYMYRLKQVDKDGHYVYSKVVSTRITSGKVLTIHPNPSVSNFSLGIYTRSGENARMMIVDAAGSTVISRILSLRAGKNTIVIDDLGGLKRGSYIVKVITADGIQSSKLVLH